MRVINSFWSLQLHENKTIKNNSNEKPNIENANSTISEVKEKKVLKK